MVDRHRRVVWTTQSQSALDDIVAYVSHDSPQAARAFLEEALKLAEGLSELSERGRVVPELEEATIREVFLHRYRLSYEVASKDVTILAIVHGARDFARRKRNS